MKKILLIVSAIIFGLVSCERSDSDPGSDVPIDDSHGAVPFLQIGDGITFEYNDLAIYDSSTHIMYFKTTHPEFEKMKHPAFEVFIGSDTIYKGVIWPGYSSSMPVGAFIMSDPFFYPSYALRIDYNKGSAPDLRNDPRIIQSLKEKGILHSGLIVEISSLEISGTLARLSVIVTNMDKSDLMILDPDRMGHKLFHYFTNGLYLRDAAGTKMITTVLEFQTPVPWNGWSKDWLTQLSPGASKMFTVTYTFEEAVTPGSYSAWFVYPGLSSQVDLNELIQTSGRIWLGDITAVKNITIR